MEEFTVEQFQNNFDELFDKVENGETIKITNGKHSFLMAPYKIIQDVDEFVKIYTDHEEGC